MWWVVSDGMTGVHKNHSITPPPQLDRRKENITKGSWVKTRTGRDYSPITITSKPDFTWGKLI